MVANAHNLLQSLSCHYLCLLEALNTDVIDKYFTSDDVTLLSGLILTAFLSMSACQAIDASIICCLEETTTHGNGSKLKCDVCMTYRTCVVLY